MLICIVSQRHRMEIEWTSIIPSSSIYDWVSSCTPSNLCVYMCQRAKYKSKKISWRSRPNKVKIIKNKTVNVQIDLCGLNFCHLIGLSYLVWSSQFNSNGKCQVAYKQGNGQIEMDKVVNCFEQLPPTIGYTKIRVIATNCWQCIAVINSYEECA